MKIKRPGEKKFRGKKRKHRLMVKVSDVTSEGFRLRTFNKEYYISREQYPFFKYATTHEIQHVFLFSCGLDDPADDWVYPMEEPPGINFESMEPYPDHGDTLYWELLDLILGTNDFEYQSRADDLASRELFERMAKERYLKKYWKGLPNKQNKKEN